MSVGVSLRLALGNSEDHEHYDHESHGHWQPRLGLFLFAPFGCHKAGRNPIAPL